MRKEYVAGIDIGTGACKTVVLDSEGVLVSSHSKGYFHHVSDAITDMDPMDWWSAAMETLQAACKKGGISPSHIRALGCSGQMQGCTFISRSGLPVRNSMLWFDMAPREETAGLIRDHSDAFIRNCTILPTTALTISKVLWTKAHEKESWEKTAAFLFASGFVTYMLTGRLSADRSNIGLSGLNSLEGNGWSQELLDIAGIGPEKLPELFDCGDIVGGVTKSAAALTGLTEGTPVIAGCGDAAGECFSVNIENRKELKLRLGSASAANVVVPREWLGNKVKRALPYNQNSYSIGGYTKACALSVKWARDVFFSELPKEDASFNLMDKEAEGVLPGCGGMLFHPYLNGENAPYYNTELRARFTGMGAAVKRGDFVRSVYEGTAFSIRDMIESIPALAEMETLILCGGGTKSRVWLAAVVDILGKNGIVPKSADASFGVALMAGQAVGLFSAAGVADKSRNEGETVRFDPEHHRMYSGMFSRYRELALV